MKQSLTLLMLLVLSVSTSFGQVEISHSGTNSVGLGWEASVPQVDVPADGAWHRMVIPLSDMTPRSASDEDDPTDFSRIFGVIVGMSYDASPGSSWQFKQAYFDNARVGSLSFGGKTS